MYPPVPRKNGLRTCTIRSNEDTPLLIRTPTVYLDREKETLSPLHENGDAWLKQLKALEMEVLVYVHEKRWDSFRHTSLYALQSEFVSSVEPDGTRVHILFESDVANNTEGCIRAFLRMDRLMMDPYNGYRVHWVLESPTPVSKTVPCLFEEDRVTLYETEWKS